MLDRHPGLVLENCSSGGMRVDYAQLARHSVQSTSDQTDPVHYVPIAAAAPSCVTPEQSAVWAYPQPDWSADLNDLTLVNALLGRVHLSGRIDRLDTAGQASVRAAMDAYKAMRHRIPQALPIWPLGLPGWYDAWCAAGLVDGDGVLLQVWRRGGDDAACCRCRSSPAATSRSSTSSRRTRSARCPGPPRTGRCACTFPTRHRRDCCASRRERCSCPARGVGSGAWTTRRPPRDRSPS